MVSGYQYGIVFGGLNESWADLGGGKGAMPPPKRQKSPFALCIIVLQLQVMQALIHCPFNTNTADICQLNPISGL